MIYLKDILKHIDNNINLHRKIGIIAASPSDDPNYNYHWIRDSALVMRVYIDLYSKDKNDNYFKHLINYIENEYSLQDTKTISGLGEPKYNVDGSAFNDAWGRPQNDGPALTPLSLFLAALACIFFIFSWSTALASISALFNAFCLPYTFVKHNIRHIANIICFIILLYIYIYIYTYVSRSFRL